MVLVFLALVPSLALLAMWGLSTAQLGLDWQRLAAQETLTDRSAALARDVTVQLQEERRLTGLVIADGSASKDAMLAQRRRTDDGVRAFLDATAGKPSSLLRTQLRDALGKDREAFEELADIRRSVDQGTITDEIAFQSFTGIIESGLGFFEALGNADNGELVTAFKPLTDLMWADEMLSREDAVLSYSWATDTLRQEDRSSFSQWIGTQTFLLDSEITPRVTEAERDGLQNLTGNDAWETKSVVEADLVDHHPTDTRMLPRTSGQWRQAMRTVKPQLVAVIGQRAAVADDIAGTAVDELKSRMRTYGALCLGTVLVVIVLSVLLTGSLRRRILALRDEAARLETELPEVMERLRAGEGVDVDAEVREIPYRRDELGRLGRALNLARRAAVETAVRETEQHRGFQQMLQRIARRTQLLIGLQLKKLDEMERGQEDPEILEGLFDLDHLTSRLRRYEENLVVLGGGQPQRRWRKPVRIVDVLRAALGEVQDYRRIQIDVGQDAWVAGRTVGPLVHILAELMENAAAFSKPPSPVEARAGLVGRGLAVEIEDRGIGLDTEGYDAVNMLMASPPELDVVARAEDARLGLYVVARLAADLGLQVEFRPSVYGGTRVIVMVPADLVAQPPAPGAADVETPLGSRARLRAANTPDGTGRHRAVRRADEPAPASPQGPPRGPAPAPAPGSGRGPVPDPVSGALTTSARHRSAGRPRAELMPAPVSPSTSAPAPTPAPGPAPAPGSPSVPPSAAPGALPVSPGGEARRAPQVPEQGGSPRPPAGGRAGLPSRRAAREAAPGRGIPGSAGGDSPEDRGGAPGRAAPSWASPAPDTGSDAAPAAGGAAADPAASPASGPATTHPSDSLATPAPDPAATPDPDSLASLPQRVRQASIAPELKEPGRGIRQPGGQAGREPRVNPHPERSGAAIGAFQRQSRLSRGRIPREGGPPRQDRPPQDAAVPPPSSGRQARQDPPAAGAPAPDSRPTFTEDAP
ncbi:nitrate- and nitrite sensing domain-containing protein [Streptomyces sp. TS71-3]|uniref:sensor histidine kinase n=1 Tax=Streptomyces sp. TS71-3 TaxID=2733862 RepID=UPI001BB31456|nr:nitrate- and nitrite sensing domain-containing protein [Streptomyces sp. TS71-3]